MNHSNKRANFIYFRKNFAVSIGHNKSFNFSIQFVVFTIDTNIGRSWKILKLLLLFDVITLEMPVKLQKENPAGCAGKVNRLKENRRREKYGLDRTDNRIM